MKTKKQLISFLIGVLVLTGCEDIQEVPVYDYYVTTRSSDQLKQDSSHQTLMQTKNISKHNRDNVTTVMGGLGLAQGDSPETAIPALITALSRSDDDDTALQKEIILALGETGSDLGVCSLVHYLLKTGDRSAQGNSTPNEQAILTTPIRTSAAAALSYSQQKIAVPYLVEALQDSEIEVRQAAQNSLQIITNIENGFDPHASFEDRVIGQSQWNGWWKDNKDMTRVQWLITGFQKRGIDVSELNSSDSLSALVTALEKADPYIQINATDVISSMTVDDSENLEEINQTLIDLLEHELISVKQSALITLIRLNHLSDIQIIDNRLSFSKSLDFSSGENLDAAIAFVDKWWQNRSEQESD